MLCLENLDLFFFLFPPLLPFHHSLGIRLLLFCTLCCWSLKLPDYQPPFHHHGVGALTQGLDHNITSIKFDGQNLSSFGIKVECRLAFSHLPTCSCHIQNLNSSLPRQHISIMAPRPIFMATHPRAVSTAFERVRTNISKTQPECLPRLLMFLAFFFFRSS
jgi:hypothetical protein